MTTRFFIITLSLFFLISLLLPFSFILLEAYSSGDQFHYHKFYTDINGLSFSEVGPVAKLTIGSYEPLTWLVLWIGSNLDIYKNLWISLLNTLFSFGLFSLLLKHKAPWYVIFLIFTNFYYLVLLTAAERLKISYIVIIYSFLIGGRGRYLVALSPLAHLQSIILLFSFIGYSSHNALSNFVNNFKVSIHVLIVSLIFIFACCFFFYIFEDGILLKLNFYHHHNSFDIISFGKFLIIFLFFLLIAVNKSLVFLSFLPIFIAWLVVGGDRVNMIAFTLFFGFLMFERRLNHPLALLLLVYFSFKSIDFVKNIFVYGDGFFNI